jgi:transposase-like protein
MVRPGRDRLTGRVEVDEAYVGGVHSHRRGRQTETKALVVVAVQIEGRRLGRIRLRRIPDASAESLMGFVQDAIERRSLVHTDGWLGYVPLRRHGYKHRVTFLQGQARSPSQLMPHVHQVVSLLKRWLLGTHHGAVTHEHLDYYLDEFTFRFNRRRSRSRGKLFFRLAQQAVAVGPAPYESMVKYGRPGA